MVVTQAYKFALDPTARQQRALWSHCGAARFAYNWGLDLIKQRLDENAAGDEVEVPWTLPDLRWEWNRAKYQVAPWWAENSKEAYNSGLDALAPTGPASSASMWASGIWQCSQLGKSSPIRGRWTKRSGGCGCGA